MHILLLGNGFDLHYKLPTKYNNFLNTVDFLLNNYNFDMKTIGDVFGNMLLREKDEFIERSYYEYQDVYDKVELDDSKITELLESMKDNIWFNYFVSSFNKDIGWIDFEKEISLVVEVLQEFLSGVSVIYQKSLEKTTENYIVDFFDFFSDSISNSMYAMMRKIKPEYILEYPTNSGVTIVNKEKIVEVLVKSLEDLARGLQLYLQCFVENILYDVNSKAYIEKCDAFSEITHAITLNYTNTYESFYDDDNVFHVHGMTDGKIVLGINPDTHDELGEVDTLFIAFKKYFQRVMYGTDVAYLRWIAELNKTEEPYTVTVMGHSLDVTDEDIIKELFKRAKEIIILYHDETAKASYIANLVKIYGREGFEKLRSKHKLMLVSLNSDLTWISENRRQEALLKSFIDGLFGEASE